MVRGQRGQTTAEYMGVLLLVAVIVGALVSSGIGTTIAARASEAVCAIAGGGCEATAGTSSADAARDLQNRLGELEGARQRPGRRDRGPRRAGAGGARPR